MKKNRAIAYAIALIAIASIVIIGKFPGSDNNLIIPEELVIDGIPDNEEKALIQPETAQTPSKSDENLLLPDIRVEPLDEAFIETRDGRRMLRFPGTFSNIGDGALEMIGTYDEKTDTIQAIQRVFKKEGNPDERLVGNFVFHKSHSHWHFENFVEFKLYSYSNDESLDREIAKTGKMTFCIHDFAPLPENFPDRTKTPVYPQCVSNIQGISVGWADTYKADVPGQELDITDIPDGRYAFYSNVDQDGKILEKDEDNNSSISYIEIRGNDVQILSEP